MWGIYLRLYTISHNTDTAAKTGELYIIDKGTVGALNGVLVAENPRQNIVSVSQLATFSYPRLLGLSKET